MLQIDHTPSDIIVVDEVHRQPVGKPYLTLAIDVYSRMVAGFYLSMAPPSSASVALCLAHAICPKRNYLAELAIPGSWPVWGKPGTVHVDNAKEFRGQALERGAEQHGISLEWRPVKDPKYGGHIERLVGTVMRWIHSLPGTTFSNPRQRKGYDSEAESALTLKELEIELADFLVNKYHASKHEGIGISPISKWERGIVGTDEEPGLGSMPIPEDPERLLIDFMPMDTRTVQRYGIQWDNITYYDPILDSFINACADDGQTKEKFIVRRDPRDISRIYFYNPADKSYTPLPYRNIGYPPMSLYELNEIRRRLTDEGIKHIDETLIFERLERSRKRIAEAVQKSKSARRAQARSHRSVQAKAPAAPTVRTPEGGSASPPEPRPPVHKPAPTPAEDDIFASPIRPFDEVSMRR
jgi:putative transposase